MLYAAALLCFTFLSADPTPHPVSGLIISPETTFFTGPVTANGRIDYIAALNQHLSQGVTPENNAAIPLLEVFGYDIFTDDIRADVCRGLGVPVPTDPVLKRGLLLDQAEFAKSRNLDEEEFSSLLHQVSQKPWSPEKHPHVQAWLQAHEVALAKVREAAKRPRYFVPLASSPPAVILNSKYPVLQPVRKAVQLLQIRALRALIGGDVLAALEDVRTMHQLAASIGKGPALSDGLIAAVIDTVRFRLIEEILNHPELTQDCCDAIRRDIAAHQSSIAPIRCTDLGERITALDSLSALMIGPTTSAYHTPMDYYQVLDRQYFDPGSSRWYTKLTWHWLVSCMDVNPGHHYVNQAFDRAVELLRSSHGRELLKDVKDFDSYIRADPFTTLWHDLLNGMSLSGGLGKMQGVIIVRLVRLPLYMVVSSELRLSTFRDFTAVGLWLRVYRNKHAQYPSSLAELEDSLPAGVKLQLDDVFCADQYIYKRIAGQAVIYSVGYNGVDNRGKGDDIVFRFK